MTRTIIHVHQQVIASNRKHGTDEPPLTVKTYASKSRPVESRRAKTVEITGPSRVVHSPHDPLPCGARVWIETESEVICDGESRSALVGPCQSAADGCGSSDSPKEAEECR